MKKKALVPYVLFLLFLPPLQAQRQLDAYLAQGLASNESIRQQRFVLEKNAYALREARSLFMPSLNFNASYLRADGGRTVDFPAGDLLNPVYATLNQLTESETFPQLQNQRIQLNPDNFYDARFRASMPLINTQLYYNHKIRGQQVELQKAEVDLYKRELAKEIKKAYYQYAQAVQAVAIYESALELVTENKRINTALFNNQKVNRTAVIRSDNEVTRIGAQLTTAQQTQKNARAYFNFLLNRPLEEQVLLHELDSIPAPAPTDTVVTGREELRKLSIASELNRSVTKLASSYLVPSLSTFIDLGSQGFDWQFDNQSRYYLFGLSLDWSLFSAGRNRYKIRQARADQQALRSQTGYVEDQLKLQLTVSTNDYYAAVAAFEAAQSQLQTADTFYRDLLRLYKEGQLLYIELLDAQNQLISARLQANISRFDTWIKYAEIERANASFSLNP